MRRHAKALSAGSTQRQASGLGRFFRGAFAGRGASPDGQGTRAPSGARSRALPAALFAALLALTVGVATALAAAAPAVVSTSVSAVSSDAAVLEAEIDPEGKATTYHFEYGTTTSYGASVPVPDGNVGSKSSPVLVTREAGGLKAATTYHFRVVAENELGTTEGPDATFTTYRSFVPNTECPNQELRPGPAARLPDCRGYEMVTPVDKNGGSGWTRWYPIEQASQDGEKVTYSSQTAFGDAPVGAHFVNQYISSRGPDGWSTENITPPGYSTTGPEPLYNSYIGFTQDLSSGWLHSFEVPLAPDAPQEGSSFYRRDTASGGYETLNPGTVSIGATPVSDPVAGTSLDLSDQVFSTPERLTPDTPPPTTSEKWSAYDFSDGQLHLVSILPDGTGDRREAKAGSAIHNIYNSPNPQHNAVSADGARVFWTSRARKDLDATRSYVRTNPTQPESAALHGRATGKGNLNIYQAEGDLSSGSNEVSNLLTAAGTGTLTTATGEGEVAEGSNEITGLVTAAGTGDLSEGSKEITSVTTLTGEFLKNQPISGEGIPAGTTVSSVTATTLKLSKAVEAGKSGTGVALSSEGPAPFAVGQVLESSGGGIPAGTTITATSAGTLILSANATATEAAAELEGRSNKVTALSTSLGEFLAGQPITGEGIPAGATITERSGSTLTLSAPVEAGKGATGVALSSDGPAPLAVGQEVVNPNLPAGTTITGASAGSLTLSNSATATESGADLEARSSVVTNVSTETGAFQVGQEIQIGLRTEGFSATKAGGILPGTTIVAVGAGTLTLSKPVTEKWLGVDLSASSECTEPDKACTVQLSPDDFSYFLAADPSGSEALLDIEGVGAELPCQFCYEIKTVLARVDVATGAITPLGSGTIVSDTSNKVYTGASTNLLGASDDLSYVYFTSEEDLAPGAVAGERNLYLDRYGAKTFIAALPEEVNTSELGSSNADAARRASVVSPDGRHLAFVSKSPALAQSVAGFDNTDARTGEPTMQVYRYAAAGELSCVSCNPAGAQPVGGTVVKENETLGRAVRGTDVAAYLAPTTQRLAALDPPNTMSLDGSRVFFNSFDALLPQDTNGTWDIYEWEAPGSGDCSVGSSAYSPRNGGCVSLISTGASPAESKFVAASADGSDVFFHTTSSIDPRDEGSIDIYDARVGGGLRLPPEPLACEGDSCQNVPEPPQTTTPSSSSFAGPGNLRPVNARSCARPARKARKLSRRASRLRRHSKAVLRNTGAVKRAKRMHRKAHRLAGRAKKLSDNAKRCRRARSDRRAHR